MLRKTFPSCLQSNYLVSFLLFPTHLSFPPTSHHKVWVYKPFCEVPFMLPVLGNIPLRDLYPPPPPQL